LCGGAPRTDGLVHDDDARASLRRRGMARSSDAASPRASAPEARSSSMKNTTL
jgi:hypothetical protein